MQWYRYQAIYFILKGANTCIIVLEKNKQRKNNIVNKLS